MISPIDNVNFKGVYSPSKTHLTKKQERIVDNIKLELDKAQEKTNFLVEPVEEDKIKLSVAYDIKERDRGVNKKITYSGAAYVGTYDNAHPFKIEDYKDFKKQSLKEALGAMAMGIMGTVLLFASLILCGKCGAKRTANPKNATTIVKDNVQNITKNCLQLYKKV